MSKLSKNAKPIKKERLLALRNGDYLLNGHTAKRISQKKLAEALYDKCSAQSVYEWEKGKSQPSPCAIAAYQRYFGCTYDYLTGESDDPRLTKAQFIRERDKSKIDVEMSDYMQTVREAFVRFLKVIECGPEIEKLEGDLFTISGSSLRPSKSDWDYGELYDVSECAIVTQTELDKIISSIIQCIDKTLGTYAELMLLRSPEIEPKEYQGEKNGEH